MFLVFLTSERLSFCLSAMLQCNMFSAEGVSPVRIAELSSEKSICSVMRVTYSVQRCRGPVSIAMNREFTAPLFPPAEESDGQRQQN